MPDEVFASPRLAAIYDALDPDRSDLDVYVAQVFLSDEDFESTLRGIRRSLHPGGRLVFEVRDPARRAWLGWIREESSTSTFVAGEGRVDAWCDLLGVEGDTVDFLWTHVFASDGEVLTSESTLKFRVWVLSVSSSTKFGRHPIGLVGKWSSSPPSDSATNANTILRVNLG